MNTKMVDLPIEYSDRQVTPYGGMSLMKRFADATGIRDFLHTVNLPMPGSNRGYDPVRIVEGFWLGVWTGASRYVHCEHLRYDRVLQEMHGFDDLPSQSTYSRFFGRFDQRRNTEVFPALQAWLFDRLSIGSVTLDLDSTVIERHGSQEGSAVGYSPGRRGRNSHHPLMAFVSQTRMVANAWLRPGDTADSSGCKEFLTETLDRAMGGLKVGLLRADSGFYGEDTLAFLDRRRTNYIIAARMYPTLKSAVWGLRDWLTIAPGIEVSEMRFAHHKGTERRYIVVRKQTDIRPKAAGKLLFEDMPGHRYSCYVTNLNLPLNEVWNLYNGRADCENRIKELKADFGLDNFCLKDFWATEASFRFIMVAYNLMSLFRHFALNSHNTATLSTLRSYCFALAAWTASHAGKKTLKIALPVKRRAWMDGLFSKIQESGPPYSYSNA